MVSTKFVPDGEIVPSLRKGPSSTLVASRTSWSKVNLTSYENRSVMLWMPILTVKDSPKSAMLVVGSIWRTVPAEA